MRVVLFLLILTIAEATIGIFVKLGQEGIPIFTLNFYRVFFAAVFIGFVSFVILRDKIPFPRNNLKDTALIGLFIALQISLFNIAMSLAPITNVVIFSSVSPFFVFVLSTVFLNEKPGKNHILVFTTALVGILIANPFVGKAWLGNFVAIFSGASYAMMVTYMRHEGKEHQGKDIFWSMLFASLFLSPTLIIFGPGKLMQASQSFGLGVPFIFWALCLGMISTGLAFFFISKVLEVMDSNNYCLVDVIVSPVAAAFFGFLLFGERPTLALLVGGAILLLSGFYLTKTMEKVPAPSSHSGFHLVE